METMTERVDLPNGGWAKLRASDEIPRKFAKRFRKALLEVARPYIDTDVTGLDEEQAGLVVGKAMLKSPDGFDNMEGLAEAMILAVVEEWSLGPVDAETIGDAPDSIIRFLDEECGKRDYFATLSPDFGQSRDEDSPTSP